MKPTDEQSHIISRVRDSSSNLLINALAGTGKTSTLDLIQAASTDKPVLCLAFNKRIAEEMTKRFPSTTTVRTFNSLGHRIWAKSTSKVSLDPKKTQAILSELTKELSGEDKNEAREAYWEIINGVSLAKSLGYIPDARYTHAKRIITRLEFYHALDEIPTPFIASLIDTILTKSIKLAYDGLLDFNDQIYMPALFGGTFPRFPLVLVDEAQDLSPTNHALLNKLVTNRVCAVGDPWQCHPAFTRIITTNKGQISIEELQVGDEVAAFSTRATRFSGLTTNGRKIENITKTHYEGNLVVVTVNGKTVKMTPNHKCVVRISREARGHVLYLMRRGNQYRMGITRVQYTSGCSFGPSMRARQEKANAVWLLDVLSSPSEAYIMEQAYSAKFGIPTITFQSESDQEKVDSIWNIVGDNSQRGVDILEHFNRDVRNPIWTNEQTNFVGFHRACKVHASNLITGLMSMLTFPDGAWHNVDIAYEEFNDYVYGLTVEPTEGGMRVYFANEVLVHNSIYGFRGAELEGMSHLKAKFEMEECDLSVSFRCPQRVVEAAHWRVPNFKWIKEGGIVGEIRNPTLSGFSDNSAIICRNNAPLFRLAFELLSAKRSVSVAGSEIGPKIIRMMQKIGSEYDSSADLLIKIEGWKHEKLAVSNSPKTIEDMAACMKIFAGFGTTLNSAVAYANHLFAQQGTIKLMTGHKAKGLEFDQVYHLDPWLIGEEEQELNLRYVIQTRAKEAYYEIQSKDIQ